MATNNTVQVALLMSFDLGCSWREASRSLFIANRGGGGMKTSSHEWRMWGTGQPREGPSGRVLLLLPILLVVQERK